MAVVVDRAPSIPTEDEARVSKESSRILSGIESKHPTQVLKIIENDGRERQVSIPAAAFELLIDILDQMAQGNAVTLIPIHAELTTQEAADLLNVSRPFLVKLIDAGEIPCRMVGRHRRVKFQDLMEYKQKIDRQRMRDLDELSALSQELNMGYD